MCVRLQLHTCEGVRTPLGVSGPVREALYGEQTHTCLLFPAAANGQPPSPREETLSSSTRSQLPAGGPILRHDFGMTSQEGVASSVSATSPFGNTV